MQRRHLVAALVAFSTAILTVAALSLGQDQAPEGSRPGPEPPAGETTTRGVLPGGAPELAGYKDKIVFVLDRSGSMALGDRFQTALDILEEMLAEMPRDTKFDVYLATESAQSLFGGEWLRPASDVRKKIRGRIDQAGGLDYGGFTDLVGVLKVATERRRPDAVYLLSDGVATVNELDTAKIIEAVVKVALDVKVPVHTVAIGVGQDIAEDGAQALKVMKGLAEATGGVFREVASETRSRGRAFLLAPPWLPPPPEELARLHLRALNGKEVLSRQFGGKGGPGDLLIEVEDPSLRLGHVAFEYSEPKLLVRTFLANGRLFFESRPIAVKRSADRLTSAVAIRFVGAAEELPADELTSGNVLPMKLPAGGSVEFVYRRGLREFREAAMVRPQTER